MNPQSNQLPEHETHHSKSAFHSTILHFHQLPSLYDSRNKTVSNKNPLKSCSKKIWISTWTKNQRVHIHSIDIHANENNTKNEIYIQFIELKPFSIWNSYNWLSISHLNKNKNSLSISISLSISNPLPSTNQPTHRVMKVQSIYTYSINILRCSLLTWLTGNIQLEPTNHLHSKHSRARVITVSSSRVKYTKQKQIMWCCWCIRSWSWNTDRWIDRNLLS